MLISKIQTNSIQPKVYNNYQCTPFVKTAKTQLACDTFTPSISFKAAIHDYAANGDLEGVKKELDSGTDINVKDNNGCTALNKASENGRTAIVKELLTYNDIDVNIQDDARQTALARACFWGHMETVQELLKHPDIDINLSDKYGQTPLIRALVESHDTIAKELLKHPDIDLRLEDDKGRTSLDWARIKGYSEIAKIIEEYVPIENRREHKPLTENVANKKPNTNQTCTIPDYERIGIELSSIDPLVKKLGFEDLIKYIDSDGFNPEAKDNLGRNVIQLSMLSRDERVKTIISKALAKGVDINAVDMVGQTSLMKAIKNLVTANNDEEKMVDLSVIKFILDQNPDIDIQDKNKQTAFHLACMSTSVALLTLILSKDPHILLKDVKGKRGVDYFKTDEMKEVFQNFVRKLT